MPDLVSDLIPQAHTFSPMMLFLSAKFLRVHSAQLSTTFSTTEDRREKLEELTKALQVLRNGNNLALSYLELLESNHLESSRKSPSAQNAVATGDQEHFDHLLYLGIMNTL